jgi:hypothetical protein
VTPRPAWVSAIEARPVHPNLLERCHFTNGCVFGANLTVAATAAALRFQEGQQVGVNGIGLGRGHAVRKAFVGFQCAIFQQLCRQRGGLRMSVPAARYVSPIYQEPGCEALFETSREDNPL